MYYALNTYTEAIVASATTIEALWNIMADQHAYKAYDVLERVALNGHLYESHAEISSVVEFVRQAKLDIQKSLEIANAPTAQRIMQFVAIWRPLRQFASMNRDTQTRAILEMIKGNETIYNFMIEMVASPESEEI